MYYGQFSDGTWGSDDEVTRFVSFVEIPTSEWFCLLDKADSTGKIIGHDDKGYPILTDPPEPSAEEKARIRLEELKEYLNNTDWYVLRFVEEGNKIPEEVKEKRHEARLEISRIKESVHF